VLGVASGAVAGLVAITPASGSCGPGGALVIGIAAGVVCFFAATKLKRKFGYDDSLDVFGVHAVGGVVGAILTGVFAASSLGGSGLAEGVSIASQVWKQTFAVLFTIGYSALVSVIVLKAISLLTPLRASDDEESQGLDLALHNERGYSL
jgi:ammonium transporter, Amt family